jgi:hypothetical protein
LMMIIINDDDDIILYNKFIYIHRNLSTTNFKAIDYHYFKYLPCPPNVHDVNN